MNTDNPLVSIGIPIYGVEKYIERCVRSLFEQTYENIEYIFVDDCTPDKSIEVLQKVLEEYPKRKEQARIIKHEKNRGLAAARNTFIDNATGEFVLHVDSDDWVGIEAVSSLVKMQRVHNYDIVTLGYKKVFIDYERSITVCYKGDVLKYRNDVLLHKISGHIWGRLIKKNLYTNNHIECEEGINMGEDYQVVTKLLYFASSIAFVDDPLYSYNSINESSYTNLFSQEKLRQDWRSFDIVKEFYLKKESCTNLIQTAELKLIVTDFVFSARYDGIDYYYEEAKSRLSKISKDIWKSQTFPVLVLLHLHKCRTIMNVYANITTTIKHIIEKNIRQQN